MLVAGVLLIACADRGEDTPAGGGNNNSGNATPEKPNTEETPINVEELPEGVDIGADTFQLNNIQLEHIEGVDEDNSTLTFSSDLPAEQIPQKGQIILQYSATDALPYGFLGRVTNVTTVGNNIVVETEAPTLDEAFDKLSFTYDIDIQPENTRADDDGYAMFTPSINIPFPIGSVNGGIGVGGKLTVMNDLVTAEDKDVSGYNLDIKLVGDFALNIAKKTKEPLELYGTIPLMKNGVEIPTPAKSIGLKLMLVPTIVMRAEGEAGCHLKADFEATRSFRIIRNGSQTTKEDNEIGNTTPVSSFDGDADMGFYLDGKVFAGVAAKFELTFFGRKEIKVEISPEVGANFSAALEADFAKLGYTAFKDNVITTSVGFGVSASGTFNLFNKWHTEWSLPLVSHKFGEKQFYLFPNFKDGTYSVNENQTAHGTITVERDLFWKNDIAIGQYDADGNKVEVKGSLPYKYEAGFSNPLTASFIHKDDYSYWSVIKWGGDYLKCVELEKDMPSIIGTWENIRVYGYHCDYKKQCSHDYTNNNDNWCLCFRDNGKGFSFDEDWTYNDEVMFLKWVIKENHLYLYRYGETEEWEEHYIYTLEDDRLTLRQEADGGLWDAYVFRRVSEDPNLPDFPQK